MTKAHYKLNPALSHFILCQIEKAFYERISGNTVDETCQEEALIILEVSSAKTVAIVAEMDLSAGDGV